MAKELDSRIRICYEHGNVKIGRKCYEAHQTCNCNECRYRRNNYNGIRNQATASTYDESKIDIMLKFLDSWECKDGTKHLPTEYFKF